MKYELDGKPLEILHIKCHRNGICGAPFHAVRFSWDGKYFLASVFETEEHVAVMEIKNSESCWRGDNFEPILRQAIKAHDDAWLKELRQKNPVRAVSK